MLGNFCKMVSTVGDASRVALQENKAAVASNVMHLGSHCARERHCLPSRVRLRYVVGQYPRFLRAHWKFLKTVPCSQAASE